VIRNSVLPTCVSILAFALLSIAAPDVSLAAQALGRTSSPNIGPELHSASPPIRLPVVEANDIRFSRLSTSQGLSQTRVEQIVQDNQGFIWFGTQYGLNRYDGYEFRVFTHDPARENSLSCVFIRSLFKDRSGALWVGCDHTMDRFDSVKETFTHYPIETEAPGGNANYAGQISQDRSGMLWLATGKGLFGLNPDTGQIIRHLHDSSDPFSLSSNEVRSTFEDSSGRFWVADGNNLEEFDRNRGRVLLRLPIDVREGITDALLYEDHLGVLWFMYDTGGSGSGLVVLDRTTNRLIPYSLYEKDSGKRISSGFNGMIEDRHNELWFASFGDGMLKFDRVHQVFIRYRNHPGDLESLADNRVISMAEDDVGNIWVGLHAREPNFFRAEVTPFLPLERSSSNPNSLGETFVTALYEDHEGVLWSGTTGALNRIDRRSAQSVSYPPPGPGLSNDVITIKEDTSGTLWVGTVGAGLSRFDRRTGRYKTYLHQPDNPSSLSNNIVSRLLVDHVGTLWVATWNGLNRFDPKTESFVTYKQEQKSELEQYFNIIEDRNGFFWMGGSGGVNRFDPKTGRFTVYAHKLGEPSSLSNDLVTSVYVDHSGALWVSTQNGLNKLNENGTFTNYYVKDGLPSNNVSCILEDASEKLWMSTNRGLSRFDPVSKKFTNYSTVDGLPGNDLTGWDACFKSPSGEMFFGGFSGGVAFFPDKVQDSSSAPLLVLTDFRLAGKSVEVGPHSPLEKSISYASNLTLTHDQNIFSLTFAALTYLYPDTNRYRYKLEGLEPGWTEVGSDRRDVTYTTLPAGHYTFHVQSATRQGAWGEPGQALTITILPPWWATTWFRLIVVAVILALLGLLYQIRLRQLAQQFSARLEARVAERTRIARDFHDTLLQSFQGVLLKFHAVTYMMADRPDAQKKLEAVIDEARQAITEGRDAVQGLRSSALATNDLARVIGMLGEELTSQQKSHGSPTFHVQVEGEPRELAPILWDDIYRIVGEALRNAFRHSQAGRIEVEIRYDQRQLRLRIRDDGKGIDPKLLKDGARLGHFGLLGMNERAKLIGGKLTVWSKVDSGTEVELTIPSSIAYPKSSAASRGNLSQNR